MVALRKLMEKCFSKDNLNNLDDEMPDFNLRKKEDAKTKVHFLKWQPKLIRYLVCI